MASSGVRRAESDTKDGGQGPSIWQDTAGLDFSFTRMEKESSFKDRVYNPQIRLPNLQSFGALGLCNINITVHVGLVKERELVAEQCLKKFNVFFVDE